MDAPLHSILALPHASEPLISKRGYGSIELVRGGRSRHVQFPLAETGLHGTCDPVSSRNGRRPETAPGRILPVAVLADAPAVRVVVAIPVAVRPAPAAVIVAAAANDHAARTGDDDRIGVVPAVAAPV